jgi:hypothetical protein
MSIPVHGGAPRSSRTEPKRLFPEASAIPTVRAMLQVLKTANESTRPVYKLLRACAYFRLGKLSRALSDCSEVLGYADARVLSPANQLKGYVRPASYLPAEIIGALQQLTCVH